jgi:hypothetical protein
MEELHEGGLGSPWSCPPNAITDVACLKSLGLGLQIDLRIDVSGIERDMPQPTTDCVDVNAGA